MAAITKTFHDHIRLSNIDGHGIKQILYPETTSDDIIMPDGNKLTTYLSSMTDDITFAKPASIPTAKGIMFIDTNNEEYPGLLQNSSNLWIGARTTVGYHHKGKVYISAGWDSGTGGAFTTNDSINIVVPRDTDNDGLPDNGTAYKVLHEGNYSNYAIPLTGSLNVSGNIGMNATSKGYLLHDGRQQYPAIYNNGDNLWIGASSRDSYHHYGMTLISAGWHPSADKYAASSQSVSNSMMVLDKDYASSSSARTIRIKIGYKYQNFTLPANKKGVAIDTVKVGLPNAYYGDWVIKTNEQTGVEANETLYVSLPEYDPASPDVPTTAVNYPILHSGNSGLYNLNFDTGRAITTVDSTNNRYDLICDNGTNLWIGAHSGSARHHVGKTFISSGWDGGFDPEGASHDPTSYRSIYVSVPDVSGYPTPDSQQGGTNYEVIHAGIINEYLENSVGYGLSSTDQMISTYKSINSTDHVDIGSDIDLKDVGLIKNSGSNFWIGCNKAESYHHYGQVLISSGWRYRDLETDAEVSIADALYQHTTPGELGGTYLLWSKKFDNSGGVSTYNHAYLAPYESVKISVPKYRFDSSYARSYKDGTAGTYYYDDVDDVFRGDNDNPMIPNDCDNYDILHKGNFQSWFLSFCSSHASQIKSALGIS